MAEEEKRKGEWLRKLQEGALSWQVARERMRCAEIALSIYRGKNAKRGPWFRRAGREIAAEILEVDPEDLREE